MVFSWLDYGTLVTCWWEWSMGSHNPPYLWMILIRREALKRAPSYGNCGAQARSWWHAFQNGVLKWCCHVWNPGDMLVGVIQEGARCRRSGRNNAIGGRGHINSTLHWWRAWWRRWCWSSCSGWNNAIKEYIFPNKIKDHQSCNMSQGDIWTPAGKEYIFWYSKLVPILFFHLFIAFIKSLVALSGVLSHAFPMWLHAAGITYSRS